MSPTSHGKQTDWFTSARRVVVLVDVVESVRLIEQDEVDAVSRWLEIVRYTEAALLPEGSNRKVKSTGDGMLLDLDDVRVALKVAFEISRYCRQLNDGVPPEQQVHLRTGIETGDLMVDDHDIYGHKVNIAARLATLAEPGEIVASAGVRDLVTHGVDADIEDLGDCILKHIRKPVRAYRMTPVGSGSLRAHLPVPSETLLPTLAVIPFASFGSDGRAAVGQILAEEMIRAFGQSQHVNVISRLSTAPFAHGGHTLEDLGDLLGASHVITGRVVENGDKLHLTLDLTEVNSKQVIWSDRFEEKVGHILIGDQQMIARIAEAVGRTILNRELHRARSLPVRTLESYTLMLSAVSAMYRLSQTDFSHAQKMLAEVIDRNPRHSVPLAWMGNWHVLKVQQGWTDDPTREQQLAENNTARALDLNPVCEQSLTIDGLVQTNLNKDFEGAEARYSQALAVNPNNALANLLKGTMYAFRDDGDAAVALVNRAAALSPVDPQQYYFDCLAAVCHISAGKPHEAVWLAERSLKANATHTSTLRTLAIAQWMTGAEEASRATVRKLTALEPTLTVRKWAQSNPAAAHSTGKRIAEILKLAGLPE
ncbi:MAG: tetratricopeptide repeat protein [Pseudomonadota bacterium]